MQPHQHDPLPGVGIHIINRKIKANEYQVFGV